MTEKPILLDVIPRRFNSSILVGLVSIIVFGLAGFICPVMADMLEDFGFDTHWRHSVCMAIRWQWTMPLASLLAALLIWKVTRLSLRANRLTDLIAFVGVLTVAVAIFYVTMCFTIRGSTMTSPFGEVAAGGTL
jgi:hypothetical protein